MLLVLAAALAGGLGLVAAQRYVNQPGIDPETAQAQLKAVRLITPPRALPAFRLDTPDGAALTPATLGGHWTVVFLGFTHCPDVCPTTLAELKKAQDRWQAIAPARRPRVLFVSVDPDRDTPARVGEYARYFHADTLAATAAPDALARFAESLGMVYMKVPLENGDYTMDHSSMLVLLDPQGRQAGLIRPPLAWKDIASDLEKLTEMTR